MHLVELLSIAGATPLSDLTRDQVTELQTALDLLGFDVQGVDGTMGPNTGGAWAAFKATVGQDFPDLIGPSSVELLQQELDVAAPLVLSGPVWVQRFPNSRSPDDLKPPFDRSVARFLDALDAAGVTAQITSTLRPPQRAYLMYFAKAIADGAIAAPAADKRPDVPIQWVHPTNAASVAAAQAMVDAYGIMGPVALHSRHIDGHAIDMFISWSGTPAVLDGNGDEVRLVGIQSANNASLVRLGASFGVIRGIGIPGDPEHWSIDGA